MKTNEFKKSDVRYVFILLSIKSVVEQVRSGRWKEGWRPCFSEHQFPRVSPRVLCAAGVWREPGLGDACPRPFQHVHRGSLHPDQPADLVPERDAGQYLPESRGVGLHTPRCREPLNIWKLYLVCWRKASQMLFFFERWIQMTKSKCLICHI